MTELESQCDILDDMSELVDMDFPTPRAEFHPEKEASSIEKMDFLIFLDLIGKLTEDLRGLQFKIDESTKKNEKLLSENFELNMEKAILHSKLEQSRKTEMSLLLWIFLQIMQNHCVAYKTHRITPFKPKGCPLL